MTREAAERVMRDVRRWNLNVEHDDGTDAHRPFTVHSERGFAVNYADVVRALEALPDDPARLREAFVAGAGWVYHGKEAPDKVHDAAALRYPDALDKPAPLMRCEAAERCPLTCDHKDPHFCCRVPPECVVGTFSTIGSVCKPMKWKPAEEVLEMLRELPLPEEDILSGFCVDDWTGNQQDNLRTLARRIEDRIAERLENHVDQLNDIHKSIADHEKRVSELEGR